jgi:tetratricopeptide (TPR) repeat protein
MSPNPPGSRGIAKLGREDKRHAANFGRQEQKPEGMMRKIVFMTLAAGILLLGACSKTYMEGNMDVADGDYQTAIAKYEQTLAQNPNYDLGWLKLGYAYFKTGDYGKAITSFNRALSLRDDLPDALFYRALSYIGEGQTQQGFELLSGYHDQLVGMADSIKQQAQELQGQGLAPDAIIAAMEKARDDGYCMEIADQEDFSGPVQAILRPLQIPLTDQAACVGAAH